MHILIYSLTIIASLLVLLMLLWHISTTHLIDDYGMPADWEEDFLEKQFAGGKGALWGILFVVVRLGLNDRCNEYAHEWGVGSPRLCVCATIAGPLSRLSV
jgi:hypothetical protein